MAAPVTVSERTVFSVPGVGTVTLQKGERVPDPWRKHLPENAKLSEATPSKG